MSETYYECEQCHRILSYDELQSHHSYVSEYKGGSYEDWVGCSCGGYVEEVHQCAGCGRYFKAEDLYGGQCADCLKDDMTVCNALSLGNKEKQDIKVNSFLSWMFSEDEINNILLEAFKKKYSAENMTTEASEAAVDYCVDDIEQFGEFVRTGETKSKLEV